MSNSLLSVSLDSVTFTGSNGGRKARYPWDTMTNGLTHRFVRVPKGTADPTKGTYDATYFRSIVEDRRDKSGGKLECHCEGGATGDVLVFQFRATGTEYLTPDQQAKAIAKGAKRIDGALAVVAEVAKPQTRSQKIAAKNGK